MCQDIIHRYFIPHCNRKKQVEFHQVRENFIDEFSLQCFFFFHLFKNPTTYASLCFVFQSDIFTSCYLLLFSHIFNYSSRFVFNGCLVTTSPVVSYISFQLFTIRMMRGTFYYLNSQISNLFLEKES